MLIDPVFEQVERDLSLIKKLGLNLKFVLETDKEFQELCKIDNLVILDCDHPDDDNWINRDKSC